jgi:NADH pyrophosphatase NudC (nudix superfamily)
LRKLNEQKFCSWCGAQVTYTAKWASNCPQCGYAQYQNPKPCCGAIITHGGKILMTQRAIEPQKGKYDLPGGYMDMDDESMEGCVYRELFEELGLDKEMLGPLQYIGSGISPYEWHDSEILTAPFYYHCELLTNKEKITVDQSENSQVRWVEKKDLPMIEFAWEIDKKMIDIFMEDRR